MFIYKYGFIGPLTVIEAPAHYQNLQMPLKITLLTVFVCFFTV